jgi:hypothetical protein
MIIQAFREESMSHTQVLEKKTPYIETEKGEASEVQSQERAHKHFDI